jgi:L-ribulose-5-phosphate 4-epimerase
MKDVLADFSKRLGCEKFRAYGRVAFRVNENEYLVNNEDEELSSSVNYVKKTGGLFGDIFDSRKNINAIIIIKNEEMGNISKTVYPSLDDLAQIIGTNVKVAISNSNLDIMKALRRRNGCYIKNYGGISLGKDLNEALAGIRILQKSAYVELNAGSIKYLNRFDCLLMNCVYKHKYSKTNKELLNLPDYPDYEKNLRKDLVETGKILVDESIVQGTWGNISVRLSENEMLITPSGMDYYDVTEKDMVRLDLKTMEYGNQRKPSGEKKLHQMIYLKRPDVMAIIHTHSYALSVNAANHKEKPVDSKLGKLTRGMIPVSGYGLPGTNKLTNAVKKEIENKNACIIANHGVVCLGDSLDNVLRMCRLIEES